MQKLAIFPTSFEHERNKHQFTSLITQKTTQLHSFDSFHLSNLTVEFPHFLNHYLLTSEV